MPAPLLPLNENGHFPGGMASVVESLSSGGARINGGMSVFPKIQGWVNGEAKKDDAWGPGSGAKGEG